MPLTNASTNMNMPIPVVGTDTGPDWATNLNASLTIVDGHDHTPGYGVPVPSAGLNINSDLTFGNYNLTAARSVRFQIQPSTLSAAADLGCLYEVGVDLYFNDGNGNHVRITQSGAVAGSVGSISNLVAPATASYSSGTTTFIFQSDVNTAASLDGANLVLRNATASSKGLTLSPPAAMGADIAITLPTLPGTTNLLTMDSSGNMGSTWNFDGVTIAQSAGVIAIPSSVNLPGNLVKENAKALVVSNTNAASSLAIIRATISPSGTLSTGEGVTPSLSAPNYVLTWTSAFASAPTVVVTPQTGGAGVTAIIISQSTNTAVVNILNTSGVAVTDTAFNFIAIGPRT